jgi:hypothetical protein
MVSRCGRIATGSRGAARHDRKWAGSCKPPGSIAAPRPHSANLNLGLTVATLTRKHDKPVAVAFWRKGDALRLLVDVYR